MISIVVAHSSNRVIGRRGHLPWHLPSDLRRFKELTTGHAVVMGRRTFESLPEHFRPLPNRRNLILSSDLTFGAPGAEVLGDLCSALKRCRHDCFVIGGGQTYVDALPLADRVYATEIDEEVQGDTFFPALTPNQWRRRANLTPIVENGYRMRFVLYERRG